MNTTKILGEAVGIQSQGVVSRTETRTNVGLTSAIIIGQFKRGRVDRPMVIHNGNIRGQLGYEPNNPYYMAAQDCLDTGVPSVQVLRVGQMVVDVDPEFPHTISCEGATTEAWFTNGSGAFHITVNDEFFENTGNWGVGYMISQLPYLASILEGEGGGDFRFFNKIPEFLRIKLEPIGGEVWGIAESNNNPTIGISGEGVIQFCLAPYVPPIEEPTYDIKYLVNGSWIYETTGPTVEQDANRDIYRTAATELVISDSVTEIKYYAFRFWSALTSVKLGQSIKVIGSRAFESCSNLTEFICPDSLESIAETALGGCHSIRLVEFGTSLNSIGSAAFSGCYLLEVAVFRSRNMPTIGDYAFGNGGNNSPRPDIVYVPDDLINAYAEVLWNLADISKFRPLSTYES